MHKLYINYIFYWFYCIIPYSWTVVYCIIPYSLLYNSLSISSKTLAITAFKNLTRRHTKVFDYKRCPKKKFLGKSWRKRRVDIAKKSNAKKGKKKGQILAKEGCPRGLRIISLWKKGVLAPNFGFGVFLRNLCVKSVFGAVLAPWRGWRGSLGVCEGLRSESNRCAPMLRWVKSSGFAIRPAFVSGRW